MQSSQWRNASPSNGPQLIGSGERQERIYTLRHDEPCSFLGFKIYVFFLSTASLQVSSKHLWLSITLQIL
jgi:hypothetical protein